MSRLWDKRKTLSRQRVIDNHILQRINPPLRYTKVTDQYLVHVLQAYFMLQLHSFFMSEYNVEKLNLPEKKLKKTKHPQQYEKKREEKKRNPDLLFNFLKL